jgi:hypothetical protein
LELGRVKHAGAYHERWRYKRLDVANWRPRERALHRDPFADVTSVRVFDPKAAESDVYVHDDSFPEIEGDILDPVAWRTVIEGE